MSKSFSFQKILACLMMVVVLVGIYAGTKLDVNATVNVSTSFSITFDGEITEGYTPGSKVELKADATNGGQAFKGFSYDSSIIRYPGITYDETVNKFVMTFIMPSCDIAINSLYGGEWTLQNAGSSSQTLDVNTYSIAEKAWIHNATTGEDFSGLNGKVTPGDVTVTTYGSSTESFKVSIDGQNFVSYAAGQPVVIKAPYVVGSQVLSDYIISDAGAVQRKSLYVDRATGTLYQQTIISGITSDCLITTSYEAGCLITIKDNQGNLFASEVYPIGDMAVFAVPSSRGDYQITKITAMDEAANIVSAAVTKRSDGNTQITVNATTNRVAIVIQWMEVREDETVEQVADPWTNGTYKLDEKVNSTGILNAYKLEQIENAKSDFDIVNNPDVVLDADDIQRNRDLIIELQDQLSGTGKRSEEDYHEAVYFFRNPIVTYEDGTTEMLEGYFMQRGSDVPMANDSWLQVG